VRLNLFLLYNILKTHHVSSLAYVICEMNGNLKRIFTKSLQKNVSKKLLQWKKCQKWNGRYKENH